MSAMSDIRFSISLRVLIPIALLHKDKLHSHEHCICTMAGTVYTQKANKMCVPVVFFATGQKPLSTE